jgi:Zn-dependent peptidase ImmA (M78 family)
MTNVKREKNEKNWTHPSILPLLREGNPVKIIIDRTRLLIYDALQKGWLGPPYDPFELAEILKIKTSASGNIMDARTVPTDKGGMLIEFNPNQPRVRIRFSLAHEIAHTLFEDCSQYIRERKVKTSMRNDDWQLEMLCNIAASEILMPIGSFICLQSLEPNIDTLLEYREQFDVSFEALAHRFVKVTDHNCFAFFCSKRNILDNKERFKIDYIIESRQTTESAMIGFELPQESHVEDCTAIGFTSKGDETWPRFGYLHVECVGIPPYTHCLAQRVAGIAYKPIRTNFNVNKICYVKGDATEPKGKGRKIITFIINNKGLSWGAGFAKYLQKKWPFAQREFKSWVFRNRLNLSLGNVHVSEVDENTILFKMICQQGYGPSLIPRIRYPYLEECLKKLSDEAIRTNASVHMPRIGSGEAGGSWDIISELIESTLCQSGIKVTVYDLPRTKKARLHDCTSLFDL